MTVVGDHDVTVKTTEWQDAFWNILVAGIKHNENTLVIVWKLADSCFQLSSLLRPFVFFFRGIGLPSEEDWPEDSPISYSLSWGTKGSCKKLLLNLGPDENDLLSVSTSHITQPYAQREADFVRFKHTFRVMLI